MATQKQCEFFETLTTERQFPEGIDTVELKAQFSELSDKSASAWIEKAMELPEKGETAPPF